jgi:hypothetical protein
MNEVIKTAEKDLLAIPESLKRFEQKVKKEVFVQTDAETGAKDEAVKSV